MVIGRRQELVGVAAEQVIDPDRAYPVPRRELLADGW